MQECCQLVDNCGPRGREVACRTKLLLRIAAPPKRLDETICALFALVPATTSQSNRDVASDPEVANNQHVLQSGLDRSLWAGPHNASMVQPHTSSTGACLH